MLILLLAACGGQPRQVSGEHPLISLDGLGLSGDRLQLDIGVRNVNDRPLELPAVTLSLVLDGHRVADHNDRSQRVVVAARGREVIRLETGIDARGRELLEALTLGERSSLAYQLDLEFEGRRRQRGDSETRGFLHAVPGQPGRFR